MRGYDAIGFRGAPGIGWRVDSTCGLDDSFYSVAEMRVQSSFSRSGRAVGTRSHYTKMHQDASKNDGGEESECSDTSENRKGVGMHCLKVTSSSPAVTVYVS